MKDILNFVGSALFRGFLIVVPVYLAVLLLLKGMAAVVGLVRPAALLLPEWMPAEKVLSLLLVLFILFIIGVAMRSASGRRVRRRFEQSVLDRIPGYELFKSLTQQLTGNTEERVWKPSLVEIEDALVPGFIIEELEDGRYTVFVPSIPTPMAGAVYVVDRKRVHPVEASFAETIKVVSRWGSGAKDLVLAMDRGAESAR